MEFDRLIKSYLEEAAVMEPPRRGKIRNGPPLEDEDVGDFNDSRAYAVVATPLDSRGNAILNLLDFKSYNYGYTNDLPRVILLPKTKLKWFVDYIKNPDVEPNPNVWNYRKDKFNPTIYSNKVSIKVWPVISSVSNLNDLRAKPVNENIVVLYKTDQKIRNRLEYETNYPNYIMTTVSEFLKNYNTDTSLYSGTGLMNEPRYREKSFNKPITFFKAAILGSLIDRPAEWI